MNHQYSKNGDVPIKLPPCSMGISQPISLGNSTWRWAPDLVRFLDIVKALCPKGTFSLQIIHWEQWSGESICRDVHVYIYIHVIIYIHVTSYTYTYVYTPSCFFLPGASPRDQLFLAPEGDSSTGLFLQIPHVPWSKWWFYGKIIGKP